MESCSPSMEDEHSFPVKSPPSNFMVFPISSTPFNFIGGAPFFREPFSTKPPSSQLLFGASNVVREVQKSVASNVDKCLRMADAVWRHNGFLNKVMSFSAHLQRCCQTALGNCFFKIPRRYCPNSLPLSTPHFAAILPGDSVAGVVVTNGILNFLNIYNTLLIVRLVLTWFPNTPPAVVSPLSTLCDPYLNIFRGIIPPLGGTLDLSPILAFLVLNAFTSAAAALPAELPTSEATNDTTSHIAPSRLTTSQKKWMRRVSGINSKW